MTQGPEWKCIVLFALPIMFGQLLQQLYATVDGIVVGNFGPDGSLAAVSNCSILANIFISISIGMSNGSAVLVAQMFGARRMEDLRRSAATAMYLLTVMGLASAVLVLAGADFAVAHLLGIQEPHIRAAAVSYIRIYAVGLVFTFLYNAVAAILRSVGDSKAVLYFLLVSAGVNTALDLLFVAVFNWGVSGAAAATAIAQLACVAASLRYMARNYELFRFRVREIRPWPGKLRLCLRMGLPSTLQQLVVSSGFLFLQRLVNSFGQVTMEAWGACQRLDAFGVIPSLSMMQATASFTGQNTGAGRYDRIRRGIRAAVLSAMAMVVLVGAAMYAFAPALAGMFGLSGQSQAQAVECLRFLPFAYLLFAAYIPFNGLFNGAGDPRAAAVGSVLSLVLRVGASYAIVGWGLWGWGYSAIWKTYLFGWGAAALYAFLHYRRGTWQNKSLVGRAGSETPEETA